MIHSIDYSTASGEAIIAALATRLEKIRLSQNITQSELALRAGISRSTLTRMADGKTISLDSFVRIMQALGLGDHLGALLPDPGIRPVDRLRMSGNERRRASSTPSTNSIWKWGDEEGTP